MANVLLITSSPRGEQSHSSRAAFDLARRLGGSLTVRELWKESLPAIGPEFLGALFTKPEDRTEAQASLASFSDQAVAELMKADVLVIGAGMINFSLPTALKTWIDYISRAGLTFKYTESGAVGLVKGKKVYLVLATGGIYSDPAMAPFNHLEPTLLAQLGFMGMTDVEVIRIEGTMLGEEAAQAAVAQAEEKIAAIAAA